MASASQKEDTCFTHVSSSALAGAVSIAKKLACVDISYVFKEGIYKKAGNRTETVEDFSVLQKSGFISIVQLFMVNIRDETYHVVQDNKKPGLWPGFLYFIINDYLNVLM